MKRLQLFVFHTQKKRALYGLQRTGLLDLNLRQAAHVARDTGKEFYNESSTLTAIEAAAHGRQVKLPPAVKTCGVQTLLTDAQSLIAAKSGLVNAIRELSADIEAYTPWGEIPIERIAQLRTRGIGVHLFSGSVGLFRQFDFTKYDVFELARTGNTLRFALVTLHGDAPVWPFKEHTIPARSVKEMRAEVSVLERQLEENQATLAVMSLRADEIREHLAAQRTASDFAMVGKNLDRHESGTFFYVTGYFPEVRIREMRDFLETENLAYTIDDPPDQTSVPVALKNFRIFGIFEPITRIFSLPLYRELDPTPLFAPFFTLFFGFCLGDVGYGMLLGTASVISFFSARFRKFAPLGIILSFATILSGILMNSFFGAEIFGQTSKAIISTSASPAIFAAYTVRGKTVFPAMPLSLVLGAIQVLVAFCFQSVNEGLLLGPRYIWKSLGMLCLVTGSAVIAIHEDFLALGFNRMFSIGPLHLGSAIAAIPAQVGVMILSAGSVAFFFFGNPNRRFFLRPFAALWDFYQFCTGILGDLLSYIRLFALALAGGLLGNAFNQIAFMVLPKNGEEVKYASPMIIATVLILVIGHGLNFGLGMLGAFVHPLRLTFVEFYKNINFRGGGRAYSPFRRHSIQSGFHGRQKDLTTILAATAAPRVS